MWIKHLLTLVLCFALSGASFAQEGGSYDGKQIRLYLKSTEAKDAFNLLSKSSGRNLVVNNELTGQVSLKLQDVSFEDALNALCMSLGVTYEKVGEVYVISRPTDDKPLPFLPSNPAVMRSSKNPGKRRVTVNVKNGDLGQVLQQIANQAGVEIVIFGRVTGQVTVRLQNMPFEEALKTILAGSKMSYVRDGDRFLVGDPNSTGGMVQQLSKSELIVLNNLPAKSFLELLPPDIDGSQIKVIEAKNALVVSGVDQYIAKVREYARMVDVAQPQVSLEINIVELSKSGRDQLTLLSPQITWEFVQSIDTMKFRMISDTLTSLVNDGHATIKAQPSISTVSGNKAKIDISEDINFELTAAVGTGGGTTITSNLQTINAGTILEVTPTVGKDGLIHTNLNIEVSGVSSFTQASNGGQIPNVRRRKANTAVNVLDGETIMIAGLTESQDRYSYQKMPWFGKIPVLGELAASHDNRKNRSELVIFVTPRLIEEKTVSAKVLSAPVKDAGK